MRLDAFPRPADDNGRGIHWSPSPYPPSDQALDFWLEELHALGVRWVKVVDNGQGSSLSLCQRLVREGFMPIVRLERHYPHPRRLTETEKETIRRLVAVGVYYFETDHRPDLTLAWGEALPLDWFDVVMDAFIEDATFVLAAGGLPAIPAMTFHPDRNPVQAILRRGREDLFEQGVWWAVHAYTLNRPLTYPDDEVNRQGKPVTPEEYAAHHPWGWNEPVEVINQWRADGMQPESTVLDDPHCFRVYEIAGRWAEEALGRPIPVIATEGGAVTGWRDDRRYPRLDPWTAAEWTEQIIVFLQEEAPPWFFTVCHWLLADRRIDPSRPHAWESHCWYTHYWDRQFGLDGELPVVERVKALPLRVRAVPRVVTAPEGGQSRVAGTVNEEARMTRQGSVVGIVRDETGRPLDGVNVVLYPFAGEEPIAHARTDAEGRFRLDVVPPGEYRIRVGGEEVVATLEVLPDEVTEVEATLSTAQTSPAAPVEVEEGSSEDEETAVSEIPVEASADTVTEEALSAEKDGKEEASVTAAEGGVSAEAREEEETPAEEAASQPMPSDEAVAKPPETSTARIVGEVPGGRVGLTVIARNVAGEQWETTLAEGGRFELTGLPAGEYRLELAGVGVMVEHLELAPGETASVFFPMQGVIQGMVLGGTTDTEVELISETFGWSRKVALSPQGQYRFVELPPGTYRVRVADHVLPAVTLEGTEVTTLAPVDLRPPHRAGVRGRVRDAHGDVLPDVVVQLLQRGRVVEETRTALNGSYAFEAIPPGEYQVIVRSEPEVVRTVFLEQDRVVELDITLPVAVVDAAAAEPAAVSEPASEEPEESPVEESPAEAPPAPMPEPLPEKVVDIYLLFPPPDHPMARAVVLAALPFIRRGDVVGGFRVEEAQHARRVLLVGDVQVHSPAVEETLELVGCEVDRVPADPATLVPMFRALTRQEGG